MARATDRNFGIYKRSAHAHRHGGSMGAYGTSQGGGGGAGGVGAAPQPRQGLGGYPPSMYFCLSMPWFVTGHYCMHI